MNSSTCRCTNTLFLIGLGSFSIPQIQKKAQAAFAIEMCLKPHGGRTRIRRELPAQSTHAKRLLLQSEQQGLATSLQDFPLSGSLVLDEVCMGNCMEGYGSHLEVQDGLQCAILLLSLPPAVECRVSRHLAQQRLT